MLAAGPALCCGQATGASCVSASASPYRGSAAAAFISSAPSKRSSETKIQAVVTSVDVTVEGVEHLIFLNIFLCFIYLNTKAALQTMSGLI